MESPVIPCQVSLSSRSPENGRFLATTDGLFRGTSQTAWKESATSPALLGMCHYVLIDCRLMGRYRRRRYRRRRGGYRRRARKSKRVRGYTLRDRRGRVKYVGITNNPRRRASQHRRSGKRGKLRVETGPLSRKRARRWEGAKMARHRKKTGGKNPRYNKTRDGGYRRRSKGWW